MRKKVDPAVRRLVENCVALRQRGLFVIIGDKAKNQVVNLHFLLTKIRMHSEVSNELDVDKKRRVLWCLSKQEQLGFATNLKKRKKEMKKAVKKGTYDADIDDPFDLFVGNTDIRYCYYKETESILGQTFTMCILQDFEAITPNILCRTVETVQGGGLVCIVLASMDSLRQLYSLAMESHKRFRNDGAFGDVEARFNKRFLLSLATCKSCLFVDDELNILPLSSGSASAESLSTIALPSHGGMVDSREGAEGEVTELGVVKKEYATKGGPTGKISQLAVTVDQAHVIDAFGEIISEMKAKTTVSLTAGRGRGKSAALGMAIAAAVAHGYANIFLTAPHPENVATVFEFVQKGLEACGMQEHRDFQLVQQTEEAANTLNEQLKASEMERTMTSASSSALPGGGSRKKRQYIIRIIIRYSPPNSAEAEGEQLGKGAVGGGGVVQPSTWRRRQVVQFIFPDDYKLARSQAELLVIDEAAAIPLPRVRNLIGPYLVLMSSTINGYEGTGRALSLKLIAELRNPTGKRTAPVDPRRGPQKRESLPAADRNLKELALKTPIRYASGDAVESWLNDLLCLDATEPPKLDREPLPLPDDCQLYAVRRDVLFSFNKLSEVLLSKLTSLFVSSHYKNSPNDLALMADAPGHRIFVLTRPIQSTANRMPDIFCAIHVALEGKLTAKTVRSALGRGLKPRGDLIPWTLAQYFAEDGFAALTGARIVRIATHPLLHRMGYGLAAVRQLIQHLQNSESVKSVDTAGMAESGGHGMGKISAKLLKGGKKRGGDASSSEEEDEERDDSHGSDSDIEVDEEEEAENEIGQDNDDDDHDDGKPKPGSDAAEKTTTSSSEESQQQSLFASCATTKFETPVEYVGVAFGLTAPLLRFWQRSGFQPMYLGQFPNETTSEFSMIVLKSLAPLSPDQSLTSSGVTTNSTSIAANALTCDFRERFARSLAGPYRQLHPTLAISVLDPLAAKGTVSAAEVASGGTKAEGRCDQVDGEWLYNYFGHLGLLRLQKYCEQRVDYTMVADLAPSLASLALTGKLPGLSLSYVSCAVLTAIGLQRATFDETAAHFNLEVSQCIAFFLKAMVRIQSTVQTLVMAAPQLRDRQASSSKLNSDGLAEQVPGSAAARQTRRMELASGQLTDAPGSHLPLKSVEEELEEGAEIVTADAKKERYRLMTNLSDLVEKYSVDDVDEEGIDVQKVRESLARGGRLTLKRPSPLATAATTSKSLSEREGGNGDDGGRGGGKQSAKKRKSFSPRGRGRGSR